MIYWMDPQWLVQKTEDANARMEALGDELVEISRASRGRPSPEEAAHVSFALSARRRRQEWLAIYKESQETGDALTLEVFCLEELNALDPESFAEADDPREEYYGHVYALYKLMGRPAKEARGYAMSTWEESEASSDVGARSSAPQAAVPTSVPQGVGGSRSPERLSSIQTSPARTGESSGETDLVNAMTSFFKNYAPEKREEEEGFVPRSERFQAITGLNIKRDLPTIQDRDPDLDRHNREFFECLAIYSHGGKKPRPIDTLFYYGTTFPKGSVRSKVYANELRKARRAKRRTPWSGWPAWRWERSARAASTTGGPVGRARPSIAPV